MKRLALGLGLVTCCGHAMADEAAVARDLIAGNYAAIEHQFTADMAKAVPTGTLAKIFAAVQQSQGKLLGCKVARVGLVQCDVEKPPGLDIKVAFAGTSIAGLSIRPQAHDMAPGKTPLRLPFDGTFTAMNATRDSTSGHYTNPNQRYAVDWLITGADGKTHRGDGKALTDYLCYGKPALAAAAGKVVLAIDGVPDNAPGKMDTYNVGGNQLVIELAPGEYAVYAHLLPGSQTVKVGELVKAGQPIARIGNSGNTSEPHLHFQISTTPMLFEAASLPAQYRDVWVDGKPTPLAWPTTGQRVSQTPTQK